MPTPDLTATALVYIVPSHFNILLCFIKFFFPRLCMNFMAGPDHSEELEATPGHSQSQNTISVWNLIHPVQCDFKNKRISNFSQR